MIFLFVRILKFARFLSGLNPGTKQLNSTPTFFRPRPIPIKIFHPLKSTLTYLESSTTPRIRVNIVPFGLRSQCKITFID
jgi:hypothetical protein